MTIDLNPTCDARFDIALVADISYSMAQQWRFEKRHLTELVDQIAPSENSRIRFALVTHSDPGEYQARVKLDLTNDASRVKRAISSLDQPIEFQGDRIADAIHVAAEVLSEGTRTRNDNASKVMIVLSDGGQDGSLDLARAESTAAKAAGITIYSLQYGDDLDPTMVAIATSPAHVFLASDGAVATIAGGLLRIQVDGLTVIENLPAAFGVVLGSAAPPARYDPSTHSLGWHYVRPISTNLSLTYVLQPRLVDPGRHQASGTALVTDSLGSTYPVDLGASNVEIAGSCVTPTPPSSSTPTRSITPTSTPTTRPSPPPTPTVSEIPLSLFLPLVLREQCTPGQRRVDTVLVLDSSTSMLDQSSIRGTKLDAARIAAGVFLDELRLDAGDQAAVVQFNGTATLLQELTSNRTDLDHALANLTIARETRIDLGVETARIELEGPRRRLGNQPVMIVLTDGKANPVGPEAAVEEARRAKAGGAVVFTIGLGDELDLWALEAMASQPAYFYRAPEADDLAEIYARIAVAIPCPAGDFWGGR